MTYIPEDFTHQTDFPKSFGKDLLLQVRITSERWRRFYPVIDYYCGKFDFNTPSDAPGSTFIPTGETGHTAHDPLYGEEGPQQWLSDGEWSQPHGDAEDDAVREVVTQFEDPVQLHALIRRESRENELKKYGFDRVRDLLLIIPVGLLDESGVTVRVGDEFEWDADRYVVLEENSTGYWKNANNRLFRALNCEHARPGS